ncbi:putative Transcription activator [Klebsormidium nitens]|uniref:Putative Transcription activator n=1 Tax=Klebsormidium nitens TaxID=105231 RepID=A0A1Y1ICA6_KLENI|nr:putative Transcription activator [Klebsormidium nitens]|eukprot:GAQ88550.1 putative Transcription activator [Klebsormidium nitens]
MASIMIEELGDVFQLQCDCCGAHASHGRLGGKHGKMEYRCQKHKPADSRSGTVAAGYFRIDPDRQEWIDGRTQRQVDDKAKSQAEVARRLNELHELQESWRGKMLETALATARQLLCWTSSVGSTRYWLESERGLPEKFHKDLNIGIQQALSRAIIEILLFRSGIEKNPGPASPPPRSTCEEEHEDSEDVPIDLRGRRTAAAAGGGDVLSPNFEGIPQEPQPEAPRRKRKRNQGTGGATGAPVRRATGRGGSTGAGRSRRGGRRAGTSVLDGISAEPGTSGNGSEQTSGQAAPGSADAAESPGGTGVPGHMSHEDQQAQANWTAAIMKVDELKPKSYKDYIRALRTYKNFCRTNGHGTADGPWAPPRNPYVQGLLRQEALPEWACGPRITTSRIALAVNLLGQLNNKDMSFGVVNNFVKGMQFFALVQDNLDGIHEQSCDVRAIPTMQQLLKAAQLNTGQKKIRTCADRQAGTESDGYTAEEKLRLCQAWLYAACPNTAFNDGEEVDSAHQHTTMRGMFLASHQFVLRGDDGRSIDLPDLYCKKFTNVGPDVPLFVGGVSYCGKTNKNGRLEYFGGFRHKNVEECAVGAVAFQLFQTFHILFPEPGSYPDFSSRAAWYNKFPLFYENDDIFEKMEYDTQLKQFKTMFQHEHVVSSKITHAPRGSSVRHAEDNGGKEGESARLGRWIYDHFRTSYLNQLPVGAMLINAGSSDDRKAYVLKRGRARPETNHPDLAAKIFPWAEDALTYIRNKNLTRPVAERDIAAQRFVELLIELRAVILQDVAVLQSLEKYLGHPIIYHSIFEGDDWDSFAAEVLEACNAPEAPPQLINLPPEVITLLRDHQALLAGIQRDVRDCKEKERAGLKQIAELAQEVAGLRRLLQDSGSGQRFGAIPSPSSTGERGASTAVERGQSAVRRSHPTFFARPPSSSLTAATEAALRAAARAAACSGSVPTDGSTPDGGAADSCAPDGGAVDRREPAGASADSCVPPKGGASDSRAPEGGASDSPAPAGTSADTRAPDAVAANGCAPERRPADTRAPNGSPTGSPAREGGTENSQAPEGGAADSRASDAVASNGGAPARVPADSHAPEEGGENSRAPERVPAYSSAPEGGPASSTTGGVQPSGEVQLDGELLRESADVGQAFVRVRSNATVLPEWVSGYTVGRDYQCVAQYWSEWAHGKPGCPLPLRDLEDLYGCSWRRGRVKEIRYFSKFRKLCIIIEDVMRRGNVDEAAAIEAVEASMAAAGVDPSQPWKYIEKLAERRCSKKKEPEGSFSNTSRASKKARPS